ncbi:Protein of unknown function [Gryllus bimaculatus]|nr:Protein of unknown function [Gryllus bimaculatus]
MASAEDPCARALLWLGALALRARRPARRLCGSVRLALVYAAALLGTFLLLEASMILRRPRTLEFDMMVRVVATVAILGAIGDVLVLTAILGWGRFAAGAGLTQLLCGRLALASAHLPLAVVWMLRCVDRCVAYASWWPLEHAAWEAVRFERKLTGHVGRGIPNVLPAGGAASRRRSGHLLGVDAGVLCRPRTHRAAKALRHTATSPPPLALNGIGKICFIQFGHWQYFDT